MNLNTPIPLLKRGIASLLVACAAWTWQAARGAEPIVLVLSKAGDAYGQVATAMRTELRSYPEVIELLLEDVEQLGGKRPRAVAAVGTRACQTVAQANLGVPLLCTLIPYSAFDAIKSAGRVSNLAGVVLDQPLSRQITFIHLLLPDAREVGVLFGPDSAALRDPVKDATLKRGMRVRGVEIPDSAVLFPALKAALRADVLLALPDSAIYNGATAQNLLRTAFEARVPLVAFSPGYVRAGALAAVYSTPAQVGSQAGRSLGAMLRGADVRPVQWPTEFEVSVNDQVARALGLDLEEPSKIKERLRMLEGPR